MNRLVKVIIGAGLAVVALAIIGLAVVWKSDSGGLSDETTFDFGIAVRGQPVEHVFGIPNDGSDELVVATVTPGVSRVTSVDSIVPVGGMGRIAVSLPTDSWRGMIDELVKVEFAGEGGEAVWLRLKGRIVQPVQLDPRDRVYFRTVKGEGPSPEIELINHQERPLEIEGISSSNALFAIQSEEIDRGRRYRLTVFLDPTAPVGQHEGTITLTTDSPEFASIDIPARAWVKDSVNTSIARISYSTIPMDALDIQAASVKTVRVEKHAGTDFEIMSATTDVPILDVEVEPENPGTSYLIHVRIVEERARPGEIKGTLTIETNDPARPRIELPIEGTIL